jgi:hypothetical protein
MAFNFHLLNKFFVEGSILVEYGAVYYTIDTKNFGKSFLHPPSELECFPAHNSSNIYPRTDLCVRGYERQGL